MIFVDHLLQPAQHELDLFECASCSSRTVGNVYAAGFRNAGWTDHDTTRGQTRPKWLSIAKVLERSSASGTLH